MKRYYRVDGNGEKIPVSLDVVIGDCVLDLFDVGIREQESFVWQELQENDLKYGLNSSIVRSRVMEYISEPLFEKLRQVLNQRQIRVIEDES